MFNTLTVKNIEGHSKLESTLMDQALEVQKLIIKYALINYGVKLEEVEAIPNNVILSIAVAYHMTAGLTSNHGKRNWADVDFYRDIDYDMINQNCHNEADCKRFLNKEKFDTMQTFTDFIEVAGISLRLKRGFVNHLNLLTEAL